MFTLRSTRQFALIVLFIAMASTSACDSQATLETNQDRTRSPGENTESDGVLIQSVAIPDTTLWLASPDELIVYPSDYVTARDSADLEFQFSIVDGSSITPLVLANWLRATIASEGQTTVRLEARHPESEETTELLFHVRVADYCDEAPFPTFNEYLRFEEGQVYKYQFAEEESELGGVAYRSEGELTYEVEGLRCLPDDYRIDVIESISGQRDSWNWGSGESADLQPFSSTRETTLLVKKDTVGLGHLTAKFSNWRMDWPEVSVALDTLTFERHMGSTCCGGPATGHYTFVRGGGIVRYSGTPGGHASGSFLYERVE